MRTFLLILCTAAFGLSVLVWSGTEDADVSTLFGEFLASGALYGFMGAAGVWCFWFPRGKEGARGTIMAMLLGLLGVVLLLLLAAQYISPILPDSRPPSPAEAIGLIWGIPAIVAVNRPGFTGGSGS